MRTARLLNCAHCHRLVQICSCCDRGNIYCSNECAAIARRNSVRQANQRYQNTHKAKMLHAQRQRKYIQQRYNRLVSLNEKLTDHGSKVLPDSITLPRVLAKPNIPKILGIAADVYCYFCKKPCSSLLRRGFLQTAVTKKAAHMAGYPLGP